MSKIGLMQRSFSIGVLVLSVFLIILVVDTGMGVGHYPTDQERLMDGFLTGLVPLMLLTQLWAGKRLPWLNGVLFIARETAKAFVMYWISFSGLGRTSGSPKRAPGIALCP